MTAPPTPKVDLLGVLFAKSLKCNEKHIPTIPFQIAFYDSSSLDYGQQNPGINNICSFIFPLEE
jgi:hypothetical protein